MAANINGSTPRKVNIGRAIKNWMMVAVTSLFVLLYGAALLGLLKPVPGEKIIARLEPIIFVIIGYYFGRLPAEQNESVLTREISRQTQKAAAAQHSREQAQQAREALEEKLKNVKAALTTSWQAGALKGLVGGDNHVDTTSRAEALRLSVAAALNILNS